MLSQAQRTAILELHRQGVSRREIVRVLGISRPTVRKVLRSKAAEVPEVQRAEKAEPYRQRILELFRLMPRKICAVFCAACMYGVWLAFTSPRQFTPIRKPSGSSS